MLWVVYCAKKWWQEQAFVKTEAKSEHVGEVFPFQENSYYKFELVLFLQFRVVS